MKILVYGETREPVLPDGPGGLAVSTHGIACALQATRRHEVILCGMSGSEFSGGVISPEESIWLAKCCDAILDYSHDHGLSRKLPEANIINLIGDRECQWQPPNALVESQYMKEHYPAARIIPAGISVDKIPYSDTGGEYLVFMGAGIYHKQQPVAEQVANLSGHELIVFGRGSHYVGEPEKWRILGGALGVLCPYTIDASPRVPLEAAACGTPTLCLNIDGTRDHVKNGVTGFVCESISDMVEKVARLPYLKREDIRIWAKQTHDLPETILNIEKALVAVSNGARW